MLTRYTNDLTNVFIKNELPNGLFPQQIIQLMGFPEPLLKQVVLGEGRDIVYIQIQKSEWIWRWSYCYYYCYYKQYFLSVFQGLIILL